MGINRIKYVNINSGTEDADFVTFSDMGDITASIVITQNGVYYAPNDIVGYKKVTVNVSDGGEINNQDITVTENGIYEAEEGYTGLGTVTVEVPEPTYETLYVTENGTYTPTADGYSEVEVNVAGGGAVINSLEINPLVTQQYITPPSGINGYSPITVNAVTAAIDSNIQPENIVVGKEILGVSGIAVESNETTLEVTPTTSTQTLTPTSPYTGFNEVSVNAVTAAIDSNITSENIKSGVSILGVSGNVVESNETSLNITPSTSAQSITPSSPYTGYDEINVSAVDSSIDANIIPANIVNGVEILGVTGNADVLNGSTATVTPTTSQQTVEPISPSNGLTSVTVNAVTSAIDNNIVPGNIKSGVTILGVNGSVTEANETTLSVTPSTSAQQLTPTNPYTGFNEVNVDAVTSSIDANITSGNIKSGVSILGVNGSLEGLNGSTITVQSGPTEQIITPTSPSNGFTSVTVQPLIITYNKQITSSGTYYAWQDSCAGYGSVIVDIQSEKRLNIGIENFIGNIDNSGSLLSPSNIQYINATGVKDISGSALAYRFYNRLINRISFPELTNISGSYALSNAFRNANIYASYPINFGTLTEITGNSACAGAFAETFRAGSSGSLTINFDVLETINGTSCCQQMFYYSEIAYVNLPSLETISGDDTCYSMFDGCTELVSVQLGSLKTISGSRAAAYMFYACPITTIDLSTLETIDGSMAAKNMFSDTSLTGRIDFTSLSYIDGQFAVNQMFCNTAISSVYFPALTVNSFGSSIDMSEMFSNCVVEIHFPAAVQSIITTLPEYSNMFGAAAGSSVLFDL